MQKYAILVHEESKRCSVGVGTDANYYESIGMKLMDVEQERDGSWYIAGCAPLPSSEELEAGKLAEAKAERAAAVAAIRVEVDGMIFDGDEESQQRLTRAIQVAKIAGMESTQWVLADNTVATITVEQAKQALAKAMIAMGELWTKPYEA